MGKNNHKDAWIGPAKVLAKNGRLVIIQYGSICLIIHESRIRPYRTTPTESKPNDREAVVDFEPLPKQTRGRHLVQNQGELKLDQIREEQEDLAPLEVVDIPHDPPIPEVAAPWRSEGEPGSPACPSGRDPRSPPPGTGELRFFDLTPEPTHPKEEPSVVRDSLDAWYDSSPPPRGEGGSVLKEEPVDEVSSLPTLPARPTRHSPARDAQFPHPAPPRAAAR